MTALITGATAGLGLGFADALAARGHDLVIVARTQERLAEAAARITATYGVGVETVSADLSVRADVDHVADRAASPDRPVDVLVNNAGFGVKQGFIGGDIDAEQQLLDVLVTAVMRLSHAALPGMVERGSGTLINVSSVAGWITGSTYSAAKSWVTVFTEGLANELSGTGVTATALCPGFVHTEFHQRADMDMAGVPSWMWLTVDQVVRQALDDADRGHLVSVPGNQYKVLSLATQYLPRPLVRRVAGGRPPRRHPR